MNFDINLIKIKKNKKINFKKINLRKNNKKKKEKKTYESVVNEPRLEGPRGAFSIPSIVSTIHLAIFLPSKSVSLVVFSVLK